MFYRKTAAEYQRRTLALRSLNTIDILYSKNRNFYSRVPVEQGGISHHKLAVACSNLPELDLWYNEFDSASGRGSGPGVRMKQTRLLERERFQHVPNQDRLYTGSSY